MLWLICSASARWMNERVMGWTIERVGEEDESAVHYMGFWKTRSSPRPLIWLEDQVLPDSWPGDRNRSVGSAVAGAGNLSAAFTVFLLTVLDTQPGGPRTEITNPLLPSDHGHCLDHSGVEKLILLPSLTSPSFSSTLTLEKMKRQWAEATGLGPEGQTGRNWRKDGKERLRHRGDCEDANDWKGKWIIGWLRSKGAFQAEGTERFPKQRALLRSLGPLTQGPACGESTLRGWQDIAKGPDPHLRKPSFPLWFYFQSYF